MKKILVSLLVSLIAVAPMSAQSPISEKNQKMMSREMAKKALNEKVSDVAKDMAKDYKKDKYKNLPGTLPLENQCNELLIMRNELDETGRKMYITGEGIGLGGNISGAKLSATTESKAEVAKLIQTEIDGWINEANGNDEINDDDANSIKNVINENVHKISQKLVRGENVLQMYREMKNGKNKQYQVVVTVAYEYAYVMKAATRALIPLMGENGSTFESIVNRAMGF